ncbi:hypothetical protein FRB90_006480 [Tulasnella sp. 427]|nr:hypothetical protein FRB90_006480 [Tulasnella sp. 427]
MESHESQRYIEEAIDRASAVILDLKDLPIHVSVIGAGQSGENWTIIAQMASDVMERVRTGLLDIISKVPEPSGSMDIDEQRFPDPVHREEDLTEQEGGAGAPTITEDNRNQRPMAPLSPEVMTLISKLETLLGSEPSANEEDWIPYLRDIRRFMVEGPQREALQKGSDERLKSVRNVGSRILLLS